MDDLFAHLSSADLAFQAASRAAAELGFPHLIHAPVRNHPESAMNWSATTYPKEWQRLYVEKNYLPRNPVRDRVLVATHPFRWSEIERELPKRDRELFEDCRDTGMREGIVVPVHGPWGQAIAIGFACRDLDAVSDQTQDTLHMLALRLHFSANRDRLAVSATLTRREREILLRVAEGRENRAIGDCLNIADSSVEWHLKNIFVKLAVNNRTAAVVKAIQNGILTY